MKISRSLFLKAAVLAVALAAVAVLMGRNQSPAEATTFNPHNSVTVSDPTPGAHADLKVSFSLNAPDAFPNVTDKSSIQFLPKQWGINTDAPLGTVAGEFNALSTLGILGGLPCNFAIPFTPDMHVASVDPGDPTSALDLPGIPGGPGYSGQFVPDPDDPDGLPAGITRYPDFLEELLPSAEIGAPLLRLWGGQNVILSAVSLNIVTFAPGQLPGFPVSMGYPTVVVLLNPVQPVDLVALTLTSDLCTPLSLTNTNYGMSVDNPDTPADEGGIPLLTNPSGQKDYVFTLVTQSDYDADDDGVENWLDTCPFDPNTELNGRAFDADIDMLDPACDPDPLVTSPRAPSPWIFVPDQDQDNYGNIVDTCPFVANGIEMPIDVQLLVLGDFLFPLGTYGDIIGSDNQADADGDHIGDACDPDPSSPTGHTHQVTIERTVPIFKHGIKLNNLGGPKTISDGGARDYSVDVSSISDVDEDIQVALRVVEGCATVNGGGSSDTTVVSVAPDSSASVSFTVDWTGCPAGVYTVQADACHAGDAAPAGLFGSGACPGEGHGQILQVQLQPDSLTASSGNPSRANDGDNNTFWCPAGDDQAPGPPAPWIQLNFDSAVDVDQVDFETTQVGFFGRPVTKGEISMSTGFSQVVDLNGGNGSFTIPLQEGVEWVRFTILEPEGFTPPCLGEFYVFGPQFVPTPDPNPLDDAPRTINATVGSP